MEDRSNRPKGNNNPSPSSLHRLNEKIYIVVSDSDTLFIKLEMGEGGYRGRGDTVDKRIKWEESDWEMGWGLNGGIKLNK